MKKIYGFLGALAILSMVGCSKDADLEGGVKPAPGTKGDMFMTMNISMATSVGSRTSTPDQGYEVGKDYENTISSALIILADGNETAGYTVKYVSGSIASGDLVGNPNGDSGHEKEEGDIYPDPAHVNTYKASFKFDRATLLADVQTGTKLDAAEGGHAAGEFKKEYTIFVVANPPTAANSDLIEKLTPADGQTVDLQQLVTAVNNYYASTGAATFWSKEGFLMSSAAPAVHTIYTDEIAEGTHTTKAEAYKLGTVNVQRAMSRFDLLTADNHIKFAGSGNNSTEGPGVSEAVTVEFDAVSMVNMAKTAYLFKVMAEKSDDLVKGTNTYPIHFANERQSTFADWWTFTPKQTEYFNPLFTNFVFNETTPKDSEGEDKNLESFFEGEDADFQTIAQLASADKDNAYEHPGHESSTSNQSYTIWRYAMENTNPEDANNQVNGNTTGVIFRAKLSGEKIPTSGEEVIYAYNNVILGTAEELFTYATTSKNENDPGVYEAVRTIYWSLLQAKYDENKGVDGDYVDKGENAWWIEIVDTPSQDQEGEGIKTTVYHHGDLSDLKADLVAEGFNVYNPKTVNGATVYYCYYLYWNRHNDNNQNTIMGNMEFAAVRNNVYKLSVNKVLRLGHPGLTENDPYSPEPGTPDEEDEFWLEVSCQILPWEVRMNDIEF